MATDPYLLDRIKSVLSDLKVNYNEKKMFGGHCFMVDEKMCFGTFKDGLMARIDFEEKEVLLKKPGTSQMVLGGKPMKGFLFIEAIGYDLDEDLQFWIQKCLEFNPKAKSSKKSKNK